MSIMVDRLDMGRNMCRSAKVHSAVISDFVRLSNRLRGQWGIVDVDDTVECVKQIVKQGLVDEKRVVIRGGSAGKTICDQTLKHIR